MALTINQIDTIIQKIVKSYFCLTIEVDSDKLENTSYIYVKNEMIYLYNEIEHKEIELTYYSKEFQLKVLKYIISYLEGEVYYTINNEGKKFSSIDKAKKYIRKRNFVGTYLITEHKIVEIIKSNQVLSKTELTETLLSNLYESTYKSSIWLNEGLFHKGAKEQMKINVLGGDTCFKASNIAHVLRKYYPIDKVMIVEEISLENCINNGIRFIFNDFDKHCIPFFAAETALPRTVTFKIYYNSYSILIDRDVTINGRDTFCRFVNVNNNKFQKFMRKVLTF